MNSEGFGRERSRPNGDTIRNLPGGTEEKHGNLSAQSWCSGPQWADRWSSSSANTRSRVLVDLLGSRDSSGGLATRLRGGRPGFDFRQGQGIFLFTIGSRPNLGPTKPPIQWAPEVLSPGKNRRGREADRSPPSSAGVKNGEAIRPLPHPSSWRGA
jgi:hypothetical protein